MKKIFAVAAAVLAGAFAFAGSFQNTIGLGATFPITSHNYAFGDADAEVDVSQTGIGFDVTWLGVLTRSGITFKADAVVDFISSDDMPDDPDLAFEMGFDLGAGYSFIRTDKVTLSALAMLGFTYGGYSWDVAEISTYTEFATFDIGVDVLANYRFTDHIGAFASLGFRYVIGAASNGWSGGGESVDIEGDVAGIKFVPTVGISWTF